VTLRRPSILDLLLAGLLAVVAQAETWTAGGLDGARWAQALAAGAMCIPLAWRRLAPLAVLVAVNVPLIAMGLAGDALDQGFVMAVLIVAWFSLGAHRDRRGALLGGALGFSLLIVLVLADPRAPVGDLVFLGSILGGVLALAVALRERREAAGALEARAARLEREREERARQAVAAERARIARELHDIVGHAVSTAIVQTSAVRRRLRHDRPREAEDLLGVETVARQALGEMRRLVTILRADGEQPGFAPQPGVDDLERLADQIRAAGLPVVLSVEGERPALAPGVDLAAYRIVQEALTNALRHAGSASAQVTVRFGERELELEVLDDGAAAATASNGDAGGGHGLVGMRERTALYGGTVQAGPRPGGGYRVHATLPVEAA
jgi:signal transduction histidine kinase